MGKEAYFIEELKYIKNEKIKEFTIKAIDTLPLYFFVISASSTNKYHPSYALGTGGLLRHVKACIRIAMELFRLEMFDYLDSDDRDLILSSLILHDGWKNGKDPNNKYTVTEHPIIMKMALVDNLDLHSIIPEEQFNIICENISHHMGSFTKNYKTGEEVLEKPQNKMQNFVFLVDYLASRRCLEMNFDVELSSG